MQKNEREMRRRVAHAKTALDHFTSQGTSGNPVSDAVDLISDLFHLIDDLKGDPFTAAQNAISHYIVEKNHDAALPVSATLKVSIRPPENSVKAVYSDTWTVIHPKSEKSRQKKQAGTKHDLIST